MAKFKANKWIPRKLRKGREPRDMKDASQHVRHRANRYWGR